MSKKQIENIKKVFTFHISFVKRRKAIAIVTSVIKLTPVDTGLARGNWQVAHREPLMRRMLTYDRLMKRPLVLRQEIIQMSGKGDIWITNNLPYIGRLNHGWSFQNRVDDWIGKTIAKANERIK